VLVEFGDTKVIDSTAEVDSLPTWGGGRPTPNSTRPAAARRRMCGGDQLRASQSRIALEK
jgi:hypothetical protein